MNVQPVQPLKEGEEEARIIAIPGHGRCFICHENSGTGIDLQLYIDRSEPFVFGETILTTAQQGPPQHAHGGSLAALLDEVMGAAAWLSGLKVMAVNLTIEYKKAVPLGVPLRLEGRIENVDGRKVFTTGFIMLPDGEIATRGKGLFVSADRYFEKVKFEKKEE